MTETAAYWPNVQAAWTVPREVVTAINVGVATGDRGGREMGAVAPPNPLQIANLLKIIQLWGWRWGYWTEANSAFICLLLVIQSTVKPLQVDTTYADNPLKWISFVGPV